MESHRRLEQTGQVIVASMGPRHLSRGIKISEQDKVSEWTGFNGATAFEPWNPTITGEHLKRLIHASMGPRHLSRGIDGRDLIRAVKNAMLQWGHGI